MSGSDGGFDRIYERMGLYRSHLEWIASQAALRGLPGPALETIAGYREGLAKGRLLAWMAPRSGQRILDNGCGIGYFIFDILERFPGLEPAFVGLERSRHGLRLLLERSRLEGQERILPVFGDLASLPFPDAHFDRVICSEVLDHTPDPETAIREMGRVLKPAGRLLVTVPNGRAVRFWNGLKGFGRRLLGRGPGEEEYFETYLSVAEIRRWLAQAGLRLTNEELNTALPLATLVRPWPRPLQPAVARGLVALEPRLRCERLAANYVFCAEK